MGSQFGKVFCRWVAFMLGKSILGIETVALEHDAVTLDFGDNAGCRDAEAYPITTDQRSLRAWETRDGKSIDKRMGGAGKKLFDHCAHPRVRGAEDIQSVNFLRGDCNGSPANVGIRRDLRIKSLADLGREFFGVIEAAQNKVRWENDCAYDDRTGEWSTTCLIDSCNGSETLNGQAMLVDEGAGHGIG
jgi:hypothetical protein